MALLREPEQNWNNRPEFERHAIVKDVRTKAFGSRVVKGAEL
jgi:hypothetical protein